MTASRKRPYSGHEKSSALDLICLNRTRSALYGGWASAEAGAAELSGFLNRSSQASISGACRGSLPCEWHETK